MKDRKQYYLENKDKIKEKARNYYYKNKDRILEMRKEYRKSHKEKIAEYKKQYYLDNKESIQEYKREYAKNNREYLNEYFREYQRKRRGSDSLHKFKMQIRHLIWNSFSKQGKVKSKKTEEIIGCSIDFFINYLLGTYKNRYNVDYDWISDVHIDHIEPLSRAKNEEELLKLCHYTNLQLLKSKDNLQKSNKFAENFEKID